MPASLRLIANWHCLCIALGQQLVPLQVPGFVVDQQGSGRSFQPFTNLPSVDNLEPAEWRQSQEAAGGGRSLFLWSSRKPGFNLSMNRRPDGSFAGNLTSTPELLAPLKSRQEVEELLESAFTAVPPTFVPHIAEQVCLAILETLRVHRTKHVCLPVSLLLALQVALREPVPLPDTIRTSQLNGPRSVVIGDAAHCVTPILGQGANAALEDAVMLADTLQAHGARALDEAAAAFSRRRLADARALVSLNRYFLWATGLGRFAALAFFPVFLHVAVGSLVSAVLPFVPKPALRDMDKGSSFNKIVQGICRDTLLFFALVVVLVVKVAMK